MTHWLMHDLMTDDRPFEGPTLMLYKTFSLVDVIIGRPYQAEWPQLRPEQKWAEGPEAAQVGLLVGTCFFSLMKG